MRFCTAPHHKEVNLPGPDSSLCPFFFRSFPSSLMWGSNSTLTSHSLLGYLAVKSPREVTAPLGIQSLFFWYSCSGTHKVLQSQSTTDAFHCQCFDYCFVSHTLIFYLFINTQYCYNFKITLHLSFVEQLPQKQFLFRTS